MAASPERDALPDRRNARARRDRDRQARLIAAACRQIESGEEMPDLAALAASAGLSRFHFHRLFRQITGLTPKSYATAHRADRMRELLARGGRITDAIHASGFASNAPFYQAAQRTLGMSPREFQQLGRGNTIRFAIAQCSLGALLVAASERGICSILLGDDPEALVRDLQDRFAAAELVGADAPFEKWVAMVVGFVEAPHLGLDLPLDLRGTAFQMRVWEALRQLPAGDTITYVELARRIGLPRAARAVAQACAANPIALAVPCHRVIRTDGSLSGYRWGVERKRALLARERQRLQQEAGAAQPKEKSRSRSSGTGTL